MYKRFTYILTVIVLILFFYTIIPYHHADASHRCCVCGPTCRDKIEDCGGNPNTGCICQSNKDTGNASAPETSIGHVTDQFIKHREWIVKHVWESHVLPAMMLMTEQISTTAMHQAQIIGTLFDAKHQLETQRLLQLMQAEAHKEYQPSEGMCRFGTNTRALAASDRNTDVSQIALSSRMIQRQLLNADGIGHAGSISDRRNRWVQFIEKYCNPNDLGNGLIEVCEAEDASRFRRDIDFTQTMGKPQTLALDFTTSSSTNDEEDILSLSANLYGSTLLPRIPAGKIAAKDGNIDNTFDGAKAYMDTRSLAAKRSVAYTAYAAQAAMKSEGSEEVLPYMTSILKEMGLEEDKVNKMLGEKPSYYAQMELLTKTLYQTPNFYTELYDKPVNVDRKIVALQAIDLMQRRDMYRSQLRKEAISAVLLETHLKKIEDSYENELNKARITDALVDEKVIKALGF